MCHIVHDYRLNRIVVKYNNMMIKIFWQCARLYNRCGVITHCRDNACVVSTGLSSLFPQQMSSNHHFRFPKNNKLHNGFKQR